MLLMFCLLILFILVWLTPARGKPDCFILNSSGFLLLGIISIFGGSGARSRRRSRGIGRSRLRTVIFVSL